MLEPLSQCTCAGGVRKPSILSSSTLHGSRTRQLRRSPFAIYAKGRHQTLNLSHQLQDMTYVKQLENYEEEVMAKRLEEMPESEREKLMASVEAEKERRKARQQEQTK